MKKPRALMANMKKDLQKRPMNTKRDSKIATKNGDICQQWHTNTGKGLERPTKRGVSTQKRRVDTKRNPKRATRKNYTCPQRQTNMGKELKRPITKSYKYKKRPMITEKD